ncbi:outer membrane lipoprotein carrier protein LolA [Arthrobacter ginkgonis]|uniref:Outer membrane lipoprotein carrier protein LolA n=2 Tax=Arthrobacter ginkgonis TaxID=1630594 RepID=A0ABP7C5N9_9MICC
MPAVAVPAMIAAYALGSPLAASATDLPDKTPEQVIAMIIAAEDAAFSGNLRMTADLGLPQLPERDTGGQPEVPPSEGSTESPSGQGDAGLAEKFAMLSGTHEARVYVDGPDKQRFQMMEGTDEEDHVLNGTSYWRYSSADNTAVHTTLRQPPSEVKDEAKRHWYGGSSEEVPTPDQLAEKLVNEAEPSTTFAVEEGDTVAGRDVYTLRLTPKPEERTLVDNITIDVDAEIGTPLAVTIQAIDQEGPAFGLEYTSFTAETPEAALFDFQPPAGATVTERTVPDPGSKPEDGKHGCGMHEGVMDGEGWDTVHRVPEQCVPAELKDPALRDRMATKVDGGYLIHTSLVNVLVTEDGRVFVGSVPQDRLQDVAGKG